MTPQWLCGHRVKRNYEWLSLIIRDYTPKFDDYRPCGRGNIKLSLCHVPSRDDVVRGVMWHLGWVSFIISYYLAKFGSHRPFWKGDIVFNLSRDLTWTCGQIVMWHYRWVPLILSYHYAGPMSAFVQNSLLTIRNDLCWPVTCESRVPTCVLASKYFLILVNTRVNNVLLHIHKQR